MSCYKYKSEKSLWCKGKDKCPLMKWNLSTQKLYITNKSMCNCVCLLCYIHFSSARSLAYMHMDFHRVTRYGSIFVHCVHFIGRCTCICSISIPEHVLDETHQNPCMYMSAQTIPEHAHKYTYM